MNDDERKKELQRAHQEEMSEPMQKPADYRLITEEQIQKAQSKYASMCAEYAACKGIYISYHNSGFVSKATSFATGATIALEGARAVGEILDILGIEHRKI